MLTLFEEWESNLPAAESIQHLLTVFTDFNPKKRKHKPPVGWDGGEAGRYVPDYAPGRRQTQREEPPDYSDLVQKTGAKVFNESALPDYMKVTLNKDLGLNIPLNNRKS